MPNKETPAAALRPLQAAVYLGIGRTKLYELLDRGEIPSGTIGSTRLVRVSDLDAYLDRIVTRTPTPPTAA